MKTACIVNPDRAVRHEGKRHVAGAVLLLCEADVRQLTKSGDVSVVVAALAPAPAPEPLLSADQVVQAFDAVAAAVASGDLAEAPPPAPAPAPETSLTADQVVQAFDAVAAAVVSGDLAEAPPPAPAPAPAPSSDPDPAPAAKKAASRRR
jgi:hypothetical protein